MRRKATIAGIAAVVVIAAIGTWTVMGADVPRLDRSFYDDPTETRAQPFTYEPYARALKRFVDEKGLVCAAKSCPPLRNEPYDVARLEAQFADQTRTFLADSTRFAIDTDEKVVHLSPIFKWFGGDFRVTYLSYDWSLNLRPKPVPSTQPAPKTQPERAERED
jgi:hypothetical protein